MRPAPERNRVRSFQRNRVGKQIKLDKGPAGARAGFGCMTRVWGFGHERQPRIGCQTLGRLIQAEAIRMAALTLIGPSKHDHRCRSFREGLVDRSRDPLNAR